MKKFALILVSSLVFVACSISTEKLASCFEQMAYIAEQNTNNCQKAATELTAYFNEKKEIMTKAMAEVGSGSKVNAGRINTASLRLDKVLEQCPKSAEIEAFKKELSQTVMQSTHLSK